jgi:hypothetical protein
MAVRRTGRPIVSPIEIEKFTKVFLKSANALLPTASWNREHDRPLGDLSDHTSVVGLEKGAASLYTVDSCHWEHGLCSTVQVIGDLLIGYRLRQTDLSIPCFVLALI